MRRVHAASATFIAIALVAGALPARGQEAAGQDPTSASQPARTTFTCPGCLTPSDPKARNCGQCGLKFKRLEYECPKCKASVEADATGCGSCGVKFDPPKDPQREKLSLPARDLPEPRNFLVPPRVPVDDKGPIFHGRSLTLWRVAREIGDGGGSGVTSRVAEDLVFRVERLGLPGLSFHASALARLDVGAKEARPSNEDAAVFRLRHAYLRYESDENARWINLGRHFVTMGTAREFVDGVSGHVRLGDRLGLEAWGGVPVETDLASPKGSIGFGGRVYFRGIPQVTTRAFRDLTVGVSAMDERWGDQPVKRAFGFDVSWSPRWWLDVIGHCYWDLLAKESGWPVYDARGALILRPVEGWQFSLDYRYLVPSFMLPKTNMFWAFAEDERHQLEARVVWYPTDRLRLTGGGTLYYLPNDRFRTTGTTVGLQRNLRLGAESPYSLFGQVVWQHGESPLSGELGLEAQVLQKGHKPDGATAFQASVLQFRTWERVRFEVTEKHVVPATAELHVEAFDRALFRRNHAITLQGSLGWEYARWLTFTTGGAVKENPNFRLTGEWYTKVEVTW